MGSIHNNSFQVCPLCYSPGRFFYADQKRGWDYHHCPRSDLVWKDAAHLPSQDEEREHYGTHQNNPTDSGYRAFLCRLWEPLSKRLSYDAAGLDYGSGPGPTLHLIAQESGFECTHYDPFFHPDTAALEKRYDFITCSETAEHFHKPAVEFKRLYSLLKPDGLLGIMTSMRNENNDFASWHYRYDPTHVAFYSKRCFEFIGEQFKFNSVDFPARNVVILKR